MRTIYYNGVVYTGDSCTEAFACDEGTFTSVGTSEELLSTATENDRLVNLEGRFVCAGFNDSHMHLLNYGQSLRMAELSAHTGSLEDLLQCAGDYLHAHPTGDSQWLKGRGWNQDYFADIHRMPNRHDLDTISTEVPILLTRCCGHVAVVNTRALEIAGITSASKAPDGGAIGMENGEPDGLLYDNAIELLTPYLPLPTKEELKEMILLACKELNRYGVTSSQSDDYCIFRELPYQSVNEAYRELASEGKLTVRITEQANLTTSEDLKNFVEDGNVTGTGNAFFRIGPLKMLGDGSLGGRTAWLSQPYADEQNAIGFPLFSKEHMNAMVSYANAHGMSVAIHAIGDACLDQVLNAVENALKEHPHQNHRHGIVHCQVSRPEQLQRIADMHMHVYAQSIFLDYDNHIVEARLGKKLASSSYSWKTLLNKGVTVSNGTDCPVELPNALEGIECAVTRTSLDHTGPYLPQESFTVKEALDSYTAAGAYASFEEDIKGKIKPGYLADFVILEENPFTTDPYNIHDIGIHSTYLGGNAVYEKNSF